MASWCLLSTHPLTLGRGTWTEALLGRHWAGPSRGGRR